MVAAVAVTAMLAGTLAVAWAMFLSAHDLSVVTTVVAMAAVVSLATALLLGRWVVARSRDTRRSPPARSATAATSPRPTARRPPNSPR